MTHAPPDYVCPFCLIARGVFEKPVLSLPQDVVLRTDDTIALVAAHWYAKNPGHVLVMPTWHFENLYDVPAALGERIFAVTQRVAIAMKQAYGCAGISTRQHNEPAGNQDVWHFHQHVFPRWPDDQLYSSVARLAAEEERSSYAARLRAALAFVTAPSARD